MKRRLILTTLGAAGLGMAAESTAPKEKTASPHSPAPPAKVAAKAGTRSLEATSYTPGLITEVIATNFTVPNGQSMRFFAQSDFSGAERASFGVYADPSVNISKTQYAVWWGVPGAPDYTPQEVINASNFPFTNSGGGNVGVYGTMMFVDVYNNGTAPVTITELVVYAVAH